MKKIESENKVINTFLMRMSLLIMLFVFMANCLCAESVGEEKANQVAVNFLQSTTGLTGLKAILNYKQIEPDGAIDFYVFNFDSPNAFVVVTGDDIFQPVIAYSTESVFDVSNVNQFGVSDWISDVQNQMREALKSNIKAEPRIAALWFAYISGSPIANPQAVAVTPSPAAACRDCSLNPTRRSGTRDCSVAACRCRCAEPAARCAPAGVSVATAPPSLPW